MGLFKDIITKFYLSQFFQYLFSTFFCLLPAFVLVTANCLFQAVPWMCNWSIWSSVSQCTDTASCQLNRVSLNTTLQNCIENKSSIIKLILNTKARNNLSVDLGIQQVCPSHGKYLPSFTNRKNVTTLAEITVAKWINTKFRALSFVWKSTSVILWLLYASNISFMAHNAKSKHHSRSKLFVTVYNLFLIVNLKTFFSGANNNKEYLKEHFLQRGKKI